MLCPTSVLSRDLGDNAGSYDAYIGIPFLWLLVDLCVGPGRGKLCCFCSYCCGCRVRHLGPKVKAVLPSPRLVAKEDWRCKTGLSIHPCVPNQGVVTAYIDGSKLWYWYVIVYTNVYANAIECDELQLCGCNTTYMAQSHIGVC